VKEFVIDFEKAVWLAIEDVFGEEVKVFGCGFHWTQCIFRRFKKIGFVNCISAEKIFGANFVQVNFEI